MRKTLFISLFIASTLFLAGCTNKKTETQPQPSPQPTVVTTPSDQLQPITLEATQSGQTALELLEENHQIESKQYDFGIFIESIDGLKGDDQNYWAFYVNDEYAQQGADQTTLEAGDVVTFKYQPVENAF